MAWFPWVAMPKRALREHELIDWLRYGAIDFGAPAQFIDSIEGLHRLAGLEEDVNALEEKLGAAEEELAIVRERRSEVRARRAGRRLRASR